jgi:hypothetical protein
MNSERNIIKMDFEVPLVSMDLEMVEADPFKILLQTWNQSCTVTYNGPKTAILSKSKGCLIALDVPTNNMYKIVLSPRQQCITGKEKTGNTYFAIEHCFARGEGEAAGYVQVKPHHGMLHIYCEGSHITIAGHTQECPREVFVLPIGTTFLINEQEFSGSTVNMEHVTSTDPLFTLKVNTHLKPRIDYKGLLEDPMAHHEFKFTGSEYNRHYHWENISIGMLCGLGALVLILIGIIAKCYFTHKKIKVQVERKPKTEDLALMDRGAPRQEGAD